MPFLRLSSKKITILPYIKALWKLLKYKTNRQTKMVESSHHKLNNDKTSVYRC